MRGILKFQYKVNDMYQVDLRAVKGSKYVEPLLCDLNHSFTDGLGEEKMNVATFEQQFINRQKLDVGYFQFRDCIQLHD